MRERAVEEINEGATRREAGERFGISLSSAVRWHQAWRNEGPYEAKPSGGSRWRLEDCVEEIVALIGEGCDHTFDEIVAAMHKRKVPGSHTAVFRFSSVTTLRIRARARGRGARPKVADRRARAA